MFVTGVGPRENKNFGATRRYKLFLASTAARILS